MPESPTPTYDELAASVSELRAIIVNMRARIQELEAEVETLRKNPPDGVARAVPSFVKPNRERKDPAEKRLRKKRLRPASRTYSEPTKVIVHDLKACPDCGYQLSGGTLNGTREVIDIPQIAVDIIHHKIMAHYCKNCKKRHVAEVDLSNEVLPKRRFGVRLMSLVAFLSTECRMPIRTVQVLLRSLCSLQISTGEITNILHSVAEMGKGFLANIHDRIRKAPYVHVDETGWRESGINGYIWSFSTPDVRYYVRDQSRAHKVPKSVLGDEYGGIVVSDFYSAYNYHLGEHQRCWVHFLRDLTKLEDENPDNRCVKRWITMIKTLYHRAKSFQSDRHRIRVNARARFQRQLVALGEQYYMADMPQRVLAKRCYQFANEMFTFIEHPRMPSENNPAERAIRPLVIARKSSGGTRSECGSDTRMALSSMFETWKLSDRGTLAECNKMLVSSKS